MLDTSSLVDPKDHSVALFPVETNPTLEIQNTFWGYIIVSNEKMGIGPRIAQSMSWVFGGALTIAAIGMFVLPSALTGDGAFGLKLASSTLMAAMAALLFWYVSRGQMSEIQVDTRLGEIREVIRNRAGRPTIIGRYGFDSISNVFLDRSIGGSDRAALVLRYRNTAALVQVALGGIRELEQIKDRLGRDLMISSRNAEPLDAFEPQWARA